ncbi:MAG: hypothetical protein IJ464_01510 [Alistipes sp.]|nr:hypothetical protein [Alistipes sp.]
MTTQLTTKQRRWKQVVVGLLVAQLAILVLSIISKYLSYGLADAPTLEAFESRRNVYLVFGVLIQAMQWGIVILRYIWRSLVPDSDKPAVTLFTIAQLIPAVVGLVDILSCFVPAVAKMMMEIEDLQIITTIIGWIAFFAQFIALGMLSKTKMAGKVKRGATSLYSFCKTYIGTAIVGPFICAVGFAIILFSFTDDIEPIADNISDVAVTYLTNGGIEGVVDDICDMAVIDDEYQVSRHLSTMSSFDLDAISVLWDYSDGVIKFGLFIMLFGLFVTIFCFAVSVFFYYRGWILLAMSNYDNSYEHAYHAPEVKGEVIDTDYE